MPRRTPLPDPAVTEPDGLSGPAKEAIVDKVERGDLGVGDAARLYGIDARTVRGWLAVRKARGRWR